MAEAGIERFKSWPHPSEFKSLEDAHEYARRLYFALQQESTERIQEYGIMGLVGLIPGSVLFAGVGSIVGQDNTSFFWDNTLKVLELNAATSNIFIGKDVIGNAASTGTENVFIGKSAGYYNTGGDDNVFIGMEAGWGNTAGDGCVYIGRLAGYNAASGNNCVAIGHEAGYHIKGSENTLLGYRAGYGATGGASTYANSVCLGSRSGYNLDDGDYNVLIGRNAGFLLDNGDNNVCIGRLVGDNITSGSSNVIIGDRLDAPSATGDNQILIGSSTNLLTVESTSLLNQDLTTDAPVTFSTVNGLTLTALATGFSIAGGTTSKTLTVEDTAIVSQDYSSDSATVQFAKLGLGTAASTQLLTVEGNIKLTGANDQWIEIDSNTQARFFLDSVGADAYFVLQESNTTKWTFGFDYTDSNAFTIGEGIPGTTNRLKIAVGGAVSIPGTLTLSAGTSINEFSTDGTMGGNSDNATPTEAAVVTYVAAQITAEDLDFAGDTGTGAVDLDSQTFTLAGTDPIDTAASSQTLTISHKTTAGNIHLPSAGASTQLLQYSAAGTAKWVTLSSEATIADGGAVTLGGSPTFSAVTISDGGSISLQEDITFTGVTTENLIKMPDNLLDALSIQEGSNKYLTFDTVNDEEDIIIYKSVDILHTATHADDHALEIDTDAANLGDVKAINIDYITGSIDTGQDEGIILVNIDETIADGGDVFGLEVLSTDGSANIYGMKVGAVVNPIHQDSGTFANPTKGTDNTTGSSVTDTSIGFTQSPDTITDSNDGFGNFIVGEIVVVTGATTGANNTTYTITAAAVGAITVTPQPNTVEDDGATITVEGNVPAILDGSSGTTTAIFESNSEYILIGAAAVFEEIEFIVTTGASGAGIKPTFWYSKAGSHQFTEFTPVDGTNGFKNTGVVAWDSSDLSSHAVNTDTSTYDIKVIRTRGNLTTSPVLGYAKTAATTEYEWDKDGVLTWNGGGSANANTAYGWGDHAGANSDITSMTGITGAISTPTNLASKTTGAWSKSIGSGGDYADWADMITAMPDTLAHTATVTIKAGTTLTEICNITNKGGLTAGGNIMIQSEKYFPTSGAIPTADSATATTLRDAALATAALGDDYFNGCWVLICDGTGTDNDYVLITDYIDATGDIVVTSWPGTRPDNTSRYEIYGALIDCGGTLNFGFSLLSNSADIYITGIGVTDADIYGIISERNSFVYVDYCGVTLCDNDGVLSSTNLYFKLDHSGIIGNNTDSSANLSGVRIISTLDSYVYNSGISDNNSYGILGRGNTYCTVTANFGDANGTWGLYADRSAQARIIGTECSGSSGNHSDAGTADTAADDQAAAYT